MTLGINTSYSCYAIDTQQLLFAVWWSEYVISFGFSKIVTINPDIINLAAGENRQLVLIKDETRRLVYTCVINIYDFQPRYIIFAS